MRWVSNVTASNLATAGGTYNNSEGCFVAGSGQGAADLVFSNFQVIPSAGFTAATVGISSSSFGRSADLNFTIDSIQTIPGGNTNLGDIELFYQVTGGTTGIGASLQATPGPGGGNITLNEIVCSNPFVT